MIRIDRKKVRAPEVFAPGGAAEKELGRAKKYYRSCAGQEEERKKSYSFSVYKDDDVKKALELLFHGKCAYCESRYAQTQPMDVEHWRPKGMVKHGDDNLPGYWWLAAEWDNLLPSCIDCNRERMQVLKPGEEPSLAGKANQFPLAEGSPRADGPGAEVDEVPLLLHPCREDPDKHLEFVEEAVLRPRLWQGEPSAKGRASIDVYALNRSGLVHSRQETALLLRDRMHTIHQLTRILEKLEEDDPRDVRGMIEDLLTFELSALRRYLEPRLPFYGMARQMIKPFLAEIVGEAEVDSGRSA